MRTRLPAFVQECCRIPRHFATILNLALIFSILLAAVGIAEADTQTSTLTISGQNNVVISGLTISTTSGDCIDIVNSTNVTIQGSQIGPCGTNNSVLNSKGISIQGGGSINIYDSYIHVENLASMCEDTHDGIYADGTTGLTLQGNVIAYNENNVRVWNSSNITAKGNFLLNTRGASACSSANNLQGHSLQIWADSPTSPNSNVTVSNNYVLASSDPKYTFVPAASDYINFGFTNGVVVQNNWIGGDPAHTNQYACGIIVDDAVNNAQVMNNVVSNTYNCGIGIASGANQMVSGNKVLLAAPTTGWATGIVLEGKDYPAVPCGPVSLSNNQAYAIQSSGWVQSFYNDGACTGVTQTNNTWDEAAYNILNPINTTNPPPLVPPQPFACVATSPYSTQTSAAPCDASTTGTGGSGSGSGGTSPPPPPPPTELPPQVSLSANPVSISPGQSSKLAWNATNATSCSGAGFGASGTSGATSVTPNVTSTYSISCTGGGGMASASVAVTVTQNRGHHH